MNENVLFGLIIWLVSVIWAGQIGKKKNRAGYAWGFFLGFIGLIVVAILPKLEAKTSN